MQLIEKPKIIIFTDSPARAEGLSSLDGRRPREQGAGGGGGDRPGLYQLFPPLPSLSSSSSEREEAENVCKLPLTRPAEHYGFTFVFEINVCLLTQFFFNNLQSVSANNRM